MENLNSRGAAAQHRLSDIGVGSRTTKQAPKETEKRRQTISEGMKENPAPGGSAGFRGTDQEPASSSAAKPSSLNLSRASMTPSKHRLDLGVASSYYFKNAPKTPMEKLVRSEKKKQLLEASLVHQEIDNVNDTMNTSYLSSSSSDASSATRNLNSSGEDMLNTSVLSDTTELTASNFVALAATRRLSSSSAAKEPRAATETTDLPTAADQQAKQREPLSSLARQETDTAEEDRFPQGRRNSRRQTLAPGMIPKPPPDETTAGAQQQRRRQSFAGPMFSTTTANYGSVIQTMKEQRMQREMQRRLSSGSNHSRFSNTTDMDSVAEEAENDDNTRERTISTNDMQDLLGMSGVKVGSNANDSFSQDFPSLQLPDGGDTTTMDFEDALGYVDLPEALVDKEAKDDFFMSSPEPPKRRDSILQQADSPARNTRSSTAKKQAVQSPGATTATTVTVSYKSVDSPARNTRSSKKKQQSPATTAGKSCSEDTTASVGDLFDDLMPTSNSKSVKPSASKKKKQSPVVENNDGDGDDDTTESLGDLWGGMLATNLATVEKEQTTTHKDGDSPARSTRSAPSEQKLISGRNESDDATARSLLDLASGSPQHSPTPSSKKSGSPSYSLSSGAKKVQEILAQKPGAKRGAQTNREKEDGRDASTISMGSILNASPHNNNNKSLGSSTASDESVDSIGEFLDELVKESQGSSQGRADGTDALNESTGSLGGVLEGFTTATTKESSSATKSPRSNQKSVGGSSQNSATVDSVFSRSSVSRASTLATPAGMEKGEEIPYQGDANENDQNDLPQAPPTTIRFRADIVGAELFPRMMDKGHGKSPRKKGLTPTKLAPSPRRFLGTGSRAPSPLKKVLTPSKLAPSPMRIANPTAGAAGGGLVRASPAYQKSLTPSKLAGRAPVHAADSPARNTRGAKRMVDEDTGNGSTVESSAMKRQRTFERLQGMANETIELTAEIRPEQQRTETSLLNSVLRRPGSAKRRSSTRRVAFGSPEIAEFNSNSPSTRFTPMSKHKSIARDLQEDTVEIEEDMQALLNESAVSTRINKHGAGSTPFASRAASSLDDSTTVSTSHYLGQDSDSDDMSIDPTENTMELEGNMAELLNDTLGGRSSQPASCLQKSGKHHDETQLNDEPTMELETDINALLKSEAVEESLVSVGSRERRSSVASRRFSIAPSGRLSLSTDGSFHEEELASMVMLEEPKPVIPEEKESLDLKVGDILGLPEVQKVYKADSADFLLSVSDTIRKFGVSETVNELLSQMYQMVEMQPEDEVDMDAPFEPSEQNLEGSLALQRLMRSEENQHIIQKLHHLAQSQYDTETFVWQEWLTSSVAALERPLDDKCEEVSNEARRLEDLCFEVEQCLRSMTSSAARKARRKRMEQGKIDIAALEDQIQEMEAKLERSRGYLESAVEEERVLSDVIAAVSDKRTLTRRLREAEPAAEDMEQAFVTLKGITKWKPAMLTEQELSFHYIGPCPKACVALSFQVFAPNNVECSVSVQPKLFHQHRARGAKRPPTMPSFLQRQVATLCDSISQHRVDSPKHIGSFLRQLEWKLGRMECTASELATLIKRYQAVLQLSEDSSTVQLEVEFAGNYGSKKLRATFDVTDAYPFAPLNVRLDTFEEKVDVESMRKFLIKNAKPGFGYLSRTCDCIAAFTK